MMTGFWFFTYVTFTAFGVVNVLLQQTDKDATAFRDDATRWIVSSIMAIVLSLALLLMYHAGVYNYITGYEGTPFWFSVWFVMTFASMSYNIIKHGVYSIIGSGITLFLLIQINAFTQLGNILQ